VSATLTVALGEVAEITAGGGAPQDAAAFSGEGRPFVRAGSLNSLAEGADEWSLEKLTEKVAREHGLRLFPAGTELFAKSGMSATKGLVHRLNVPAHVVNHLAAIVCGERLDSGYLRHCLGANSPTRLIKDAAYPSIRLSDIATMKIPLPSLAEQRRIAEVLDRAEGLRAKRRAAFVQLDFLIQSLFLDLFGDPYTNPKGLGKEALEQITLNITDGKHGDCRPSPESGYFFVSVKDIKDGQIDYSGARQIDPDDFMEVHRRTRLEEGDVLITNSGTIGKTAVVAASPQLDRTTFQKSVAIVKPKREKLESLYLRTALDMCAAKLSRA
jgi:type I restriction enzyme S subunit